MVGHPTPGLISAYLRHSSIPRAKTVDDRNKMEEVARATSVPCLEHGVKGTLW